MLKYSKITVWLATNLGNCFCLLPFIMITVNPSCFTARPGNTRDHFDLESPNWTTFVEKPILHIYTLEYLIIAHCGFIYFQEKSCPVHLLALYWTVLWQPCVFINFGKIPCPVRLFHTVGLLDTPEYAFPIKVSI